MDFFGFSKVGSGSSSQALQDIPKEYTSLSFYELHMLEHIFVTITLDHPRSVSVDPYIISALSALNYVQGELSNNKGQFQTLSDEVLNELSQVMNFYEQCRDQQPREPLYY